MNTTIYFVRHGQTENPEGIYYGRIPGFHLSKEGEEQAKRVGEFLRGKTIEVIYTSPLERTFETANIIGSFLPDVKIVHDYDLIEVNMAGWQGLKFDEAFKNEEHVHFLNDSKARVQGENLTQLAKRMREVVAKICEKHSGKEVVCVSHEFPIIALELNLKNHPLEELKAIDLTAGSVTKFVLGENCELKESDYIELQ
jgi:broad specificity phosphatase PhoE